MEQSATVITAKNENLFNTVKYELEADGRLVRNASAQVHRYAYTAGWAAVTHGMGSRGITIQIL